MMKRSITAICSTAMLLAGTVSAAPFVIPLSGGTTSPSYRGLPDTHHFGWASGTFDGSNANGLLDDPEITIGNSALDPSVSLIADPAAILSSSGNIYKNGSTLNASLLVPVPGMPGVGFTTIIVQGGGVGSPYGTRVPAFGIAGGDVPDVVVASNANSRGQFWAKYEILGNAGNYAIPITGTNPPNIPSIAELQVDVLWSASGFAPDTATALVPEPASLALACSFLMYLGRRNGSR